MFRKTRFQLLFSYLAVLALVLVIFAIAVRVIFSRSLKQQTIEKLINLGQGAMTEAELENGRLKIDDDFSLQGLTARSQGLQWFDLRGNLVGQRGSYVLSLPFSTHETVQIDKTNKKKIIGVTLPLIGSDDRQIVGYIRACQSLEDLEETLNKLDWGLGGGIAIALVLSGVGGVLLTRQAMQPLEQSFQRLKQFTSDASHELRSPLMAIKTNVNVALKYPEGMRDTDAEKFQAIASATNQMARLTEDLLLLARGDSASAPLRDRAIEFQREIVVIEDILANLIQVYQLQAEAKQIKLKANLDKSIRLLGDAVLLTRIFDNLIENALNYTRSGGTIEINTNLVDRQAEIAVKDTGIGIAPEDIEKIFERFWRADTARNYRSGGSGLGLAIAQTIVQNYGGLITVTSQLGVGSCFTVRLRAIT